MFLSASSVSIVRSIKATLAISGISLLTACGGTTEQLNPTWETTVADPITVDQDYMRNVHTVAMDDWGDVIVVGESTPVYWADSVRGTDLYVSKLTADGQEIWTDLYDFGGKSESIWGVAVDSSQGTIYAAGTGFLAAIDRFGNLLWSSNGVSNVRNIAFHNDKVYVTGNALTVFSANGDLLQTISTNDEAIWDVKVAEDGSAIVAGHSFVAKFDDLGNELWKTSTENDVNYVASLHIDANGDIYLAQGVFGGSDARVSKYAANGAKQWSELAAFGFETSDLPGDPKLVPTPSGNIALVMSGGSSNKWQREVTEFNKANGNVLDSTVFDGGRTKQASALSNGFIAMAGHGQLDVLDSESRVQYRFGNRTSASSLSSGLWVDGNDVYFGFTTALQSNGTARAVTVAKFQL